MSLPALPTCTWSNDDGETQCGQVAYGVIEEMPACDEHRAGNNGINWDASPYATHLREARAELDRLRRR